MGLHYGLDEGVRHVIGRYAAPDSFTILRFNLTIVLLPCLGGLIGGLVVWRLNRGDTRQGTNLFIDAFHRRGGRLPLGGPLNKAVASIGVISAGGSAGPEGPMAALGAAIGSSVARRFSLTPRDCRVMLVAGCAGGIGAVFQCPLGGALFAASVLYREPELEANSVVPAFVSSVVSYSTFMYSPGFGHRLLAGADRLAFTTPWELIP
jgi:CIC family chloride channel protein